MVQDSSTSPTNFTAENDTIIGDNTNTSINTNDDDATMDCSTSSDPTSALLEALSHKEAGNTHFQSGNFTEATRCYRKAITLLKRFPSDDQVQALLVMLQTNMSMVCYKQDKFVLSRDLATKALDVESNNVKALYRRAMAHRALGDDDRARADLKLAIQVDPGNVAVKKEWMELKRRMEGKKAQEKEVLQKAFQKSGSLLYQDKEMEERQREKDRREREMAEREVLAKRRGEWEKECAEKVRVGQEPLSFEEWDTERKKREEKAEEAKRKAKEGEEKRRREERRKANEAQKQTVTDHDSDDDELLEKELGMLRGYKKTSDGRTTSYFTREQTEQEKQLIGCIQPKRLDSNALDSPTATIGPTLIHSSSSIGSVWNQSGTTWEEKNTTEWCKNCLKDCLLESATAYASSWKDECATYIATVKNVEELEGDASVAFAGGKTRYIYDFHTSLNYDIRNDTDEIIASGSLRLPDINSATTAEAELEVDVLAWTSTPSSSGVKVSDVEECRNMLVQEVRRSVLKFVEKFNANY